jgi:sterol desaturase/sphingolipid hydroxylase (fatty acid hydroxylase superfamily)
MKVTPRDQALVIFRYPFTMRFLLCRTPLRVVIFTTVPLMIGCAWLGWSSSPWPKALLGVSLGLVYWSLFEYAVHRWLYHVAFRAGRWRNFIESLHLYHHRELADPRVLNAGPLLTYPLLAVLLLPVYLASGFDGAFTGRVGIGILGYYTFYEFVHYGIHYRVFPSGYMGMIQRYHLFHHEGAHWGSNFGNTSPLWDRLLGTYDPAWRVYEVSPRMAETLVHRKPFRK